MEFIYKYSFLGIAFVMAIILLIISIQECFERGKLYKGKLTISMVNIFIILGFFLIYEKYILPNKVLQIILLCYLALIFVLFTLTILFIASYSNQKANNYTQFINSLNKTTFNVYFLCDKKDRIKEISESLLNDLGLKKERVIGRKAFDVFNETIRFTKLNDVDVTNNELKEYYKNFHKLAKPEEEFKREIYFQNSNGNTVVLNLVEKPIFVSGNYKGRINIGQKKTDASLAHVEQELESKNQDLESIQYKFIAALELTEEGIFFNDLDGSYLWANDILVKDLKLSSNTISYEDYKRLIHPDDISIYNSLIKNLTPERPNYSLTYRVMINGKYEFVKESGKRIFEDPNQMTILGFAKKIDTNYFQKTNMPNIDSVKNIDEMLVDLDKLYSDHRLFQLVCLNLTSLPDINNRFGRGVGNMVMEEYLKKVKSNFLTESSNLYRSSGLVFYFTLTDPRKMEFFKRALEASPTAMNLCMNYGSLKAELVVNIGVAEATQDGLNKEELIKNCNQAINASLNPNYSVNYCYFKELKKIGIR